MRIALIADVFPPLRSSGAVQMRDLSLEFVRQGHEVTMMVASPELRQPFSIEDWRGVRVVRLRAPKTKDIGYVRRTINEFLMPFTMLRNLRKSLLAAERWDGVVWYSPTIFLGPLVRALKQTSACPSYLVIRDIFPEWAVDMGLMGRGLPYRVFKAIANYQYSIADVIGIQTEGNRVYFEKVLRAASQRVEVLQNWLASAPAAGCSISISSTSLVGRKIFVYAGNMGVAQGMGVLLDLAERLVHRDDVGFLFVGRGSDAHHLRADARRRGLVNVMFFDEIDPNDIPSLYAQCHVGLVALDPRHKTHNIPGKFLSYMQAGLPVLASINPGNDLVELISKNNVGRVCTDTSSDSLAVNALQLLEGIECDAHYATRCYELADELFSPEVAVRQIVCALRG
ncbi:MAG: glycosyltransferase family 4 protein [Betaproteobacteria bacterium]